MGYQTDSPDDPQLSVMGNPIQISGIPIELRLDRRQRFASLPEISGFLSQNCPVAERIEMCRLFRGEDWNGSSTEITDLQLNARAEKGSHYEVENWRVQ